MTLRRFLALALTLAGLLGTIDAQRRKLSGPLPTAYLSDVSAFWLANGRIVYREFGTGTSDYLTLPLNGGAPPEVLELAAGFHRVELTPDGARMLLIGTDLRSLFSIPADGSGTRVQLNAPLGAGLRIRSHAVSEDSAFVVYEVGMEAGAGLAYSVRVDGSQPAVQLHAEGIGRYELTSDSSRVVFLSWQNKLYTVPIAGGTAPVLVQSQPPRGVAEFALAPDASRVVYRCDAAELFVQELWSAPVDASQPPVKLNAPLVAGGDVARFHVSRHSQHVTYVADQAVDGTNGLYAVPIAGGAVIELSAGVAGRDVVEEQSSPDRTHMLFLANHTGSSLDLYSVPIDGSQPAVNLTEALPLAVQGFVFDPPTGRVVFRIYAAGGRHELWSAPSDGSALPVRLDPLGSTDGVQDFAIAAGSRVVFLSDPDVPEHQELYSVRVDGSAPALRLNSALPPDGQVFSFVLDGARARALYRAEQDIDDVTELFLVPVDGSAPPSVRSTVREHVSTVGGVQRMAATPDGARALYFADESAGRGLFAVDLDGTPEPALLAEMQWPPPEIRITPDSQHAVYEGSGLSSLRMDGVGTATQIAGDPWVWSIAPDSSRVAFSQIVENYEPPTRLYSVPVAGGEQLELNLPRAVNGEIFSLEISPDSSRVVYAAVQYTVGVTELYSAPLAGGAAAVKLSGSMVSGGDVVADEWFGLPRISADSSRVVYLADRDVNQSVELYSAPLAGGAPPTELSAIPAGDRDVTSFAISPDCTRVVYVADQTADDRYELYSVPLAGGAPLELSAIASGDRDVDEQPILAFPGQPQPFLISPDSGWVVYRADQDVDDGFDLYAVPLAGGAAPVRLTFDATTGAQLALLAIGADSGRVVYERRSAGVLDLYSVPIDGGAAPVRLNGALPVVESFPFPDAELDPTGRFVTFHAEPDHPGAVELFLVPVHGRSAPMRVNAPLASAGPALVNGIFRGIFRPGRNAVLYIAEQDAGGVGELYINELAGTRSGPAVRR